VFTVSLTFFRVTQGVAGDRSLTTDVGAKRTQRCPWLYAWSWPKAGPETLSNRRTAPN